RKRQCGQQQPVCWSSRQLNGVFRQGQRTY
ncbi:tonB-dependent Receptor Plug domain protein, partial [Vibrio parahaemolyticus V14/01]